MVNVMAYWENVSDNIASIAKLRKKSDIFSFRCIKS